MKAALSKPLLAALLATAVTTTVVLLRPEPDSESATVVSDLLPAGKVRPEGRGVAELTWARPLPTGKPHGDDFGLITPVPPPAPPPAPVVPEPVVVPPPAAPAPAFSYLGRMIRDGKEYAFLQKGENVEVVAVGEDLDDKWRLERVSESGLEIRYLPLNEMKQLAISGR